MDTNVAEAVVHAFDLNVEDVLENWPSAFAIRELIANALDEYRITRTAQPDIWQDESNHWHVTDHGRGVRYAHLTQNENPEKKKHPEVIGQFGIGLKDALAVLERKGVEVGILSRHGDITFRRRPKAEFADVVTLHALVAPPSDRGRLGTDIVLKGVTELDIDQAKQFFLHFEDRQVLENTKYGQVLERRPKEVARIYVRGLLVGTEENFLFSYNITALSAPLRKALNRERSNVGRGAYSDQVKRMLLACASPAVANPLTTDLGRFSTGRMHDELAWKDVALHACRVLQTFEKVIFVSYYDQVEYPQMIERAVADGYRVVVVPDNIASSLGKLADLNGNPLVGTEEYIREWNDSFDITPIPECELSAVERAVFARTEDIARLLKIRIGRAPVRTVVVCERMRMDTYGEQVAGLWDAAEHRIVIRRDQLGNLGTYAGTLLHELTHARGGNPDVSLAFEQDLTRSLGDVAGPRLASAG
ncbi:MAG: ATP-binding protein [Mycobacteriales bacterium]